MNAPRSKSLWCMLQAAQAISFEVGATGNVPFDVSRFQCDMLRAHSGGRNHKLHIDIHRPSESAHAETRITFSPDNLFQNWNV